MGWWHEGEEKELEMLPDFGDRLEYRNPLC
jgi:hypothetical protein